MLLLVTLSLLSNKLDLDCCPKIESPDVLLKMLSVFFTGSDGLEFTAAPTLKMLLEVELEANRFVPDEVELEANRFVLDELIGLEGAPPKENNELPEEACWSLPEVLFGGPKMLLEASVLGVGPENNDVLGFSVLSTGEVPAENSDGVVELLALVTVVSTLGVPAASSVLGELPNKNNELPVAAGADFSGNPLEDVPKIPVADTFSVDEAAGKSRAKRLPDEALANIEVAPLLFLLGALGAVVPNKLPEVENKADATAGLS